MANIEKRLNKDGIPTYRVGIRRKGHESQYATFSDLETAKLWAKQIEDAMKFEEHFPEKARYSFKEVVDRYKKEQIPNLSDQEQEKRNSQLDFWVDKFSEFNIHEITPTMIKSVLNKLSKTITVRNKKPISPKTIHRRLAALSHVFTISMVKWHYINQNPCMLVERPETKTIRIGNYSKAYSANEIVIYFEDSEFKIKWKGEDIGDEIVDILKNRLGKELVEKL